jgi:hypothetical protein
MEMLVLEQIIHQIYYSYIQYQHNAFLALDASGGTGQRISAGNGATSRASRIDFLNIPAYPTVPRWSTAGTKYSGLSYCSKMEYCWDHRLNDVFFSVDKADALCGKGNHLRNISTRQKREI